MSALQQLFIAQAHVARWRAEHENASARLELAEAAECMAYLVSQHEPLHSLGIDRNVMTVLLSFVQHHDKHRLERALAQLAKEKT